MKNLSGDPTSGQPGNGLRVSDFDFELPAELIAQQPPEERGQSRMLVVDRTAGGLRDAHFADFPALLKPGDLLVLNDSRVLPARLYARRTVVRDRLQPTALVEVFLTEQVGGASGVSGVGGVGGVGGVSAVSRVSGVSTVRRTKIASPLTLRGCNRFQATCARRGMR